MSLKENVISIKTTITPIKYLVFDSFSGFLIIACSNITHDLVIFETTANVYSVRKHNEDKCSLRF